jgi:hypothetical protein
MTCHPTDGRHPQISGKQPPDTVEPHECAGALILMQREMMKAQATPDHLFKRYRREHPKGLTLQGMRRIVERVLFGGVFGSPMSRPDLNDADIQYEPLGKFSVTQTTKERKHNMTAKGEAAREAIDALFSDTKVEKQVTLDDLEELQGDIDGKIDAIKADIKHEQE